MENIFFYIISILIVLSALGVVLLNKHFYIVLSFLICILSIGFLFMFMKSVTLFLFIFIPLPAIIVGLLLIGIGGRQDLGLDWRKDWLRTFVAFIISISTLLSFIFMINNIKFKEAIISEIQPIFITKVSEILFVEYATLLGIIFVYFITFFVGIYLVSKNRK